MPTKNNQQAEIPSTSDPQAARGPTTKPKSTGRPRARTGKVVKK